MTDDLDALAGLTTLVNMNLTDTAKSVTSQTDKRNLFKRGIIAPKQIIEKAVKGLKKTPGGGMETTPAPSTLAPFHPNTTPQFPSTIPMLGNILPCLDDSRANPGYTPTPQENGNAFKQLEFSFCDDFLKEKNLEKLEGMINSLYSLLYKMDRDISFVKNMLIHINTQISDANNELGDDVDITEGLNNAEDGSNQ